MKNPTGIVELPAGVVEVSSEIVLPAGAHDLEIRGAKEGTVIRATTTFKGRAIFVARGGTNIQFHDFEIAGNRAAIAEVQGLAPSDVPFSRFTRNSGIAVEGIQKLTIANLQMREIAGFAVLVNHSSQVRIDKIDVQDSGAGNAKKRNNSTGGILIEEGSTDFEVTHCSLKNIRGNGIWTHSMYESPRNARGKITSNAVDHVGRDAYQVGHATDVRVENNTAMAVGFPETEIDSDNGAIPVALDTAGNVEKTSYVSNHFSETNGKCIDLDGFHDGEVRDNICENRQPPEAYKFGNYGIVMNNSNPDMQSRNVRITGNILDGTLFGGIFIIGTGNVVTKNRLLNINMAHCPDNAKRFGCYLAADELDILRTGIYLGRGAHRPDPATGNTIEDNFIIGFGMGNHCLGTAPGVSLEKNKVNRNECSDDTMVNAGNGVNQLPVGNMLETFEGKKLTVAPR